jgi:hypothetical protein
MIMTKHELELVHLRAMQDWMNEEYNTRMMVTQQNISGFSDQLKKEEAALEKYRHAQRAFIEGPKE